MHILAAGRINKASAGTSNPKNMRSSGASSHKHPASASTSTRPAGGQPATSKGAVHAVGERTTRNANKDHYSGQLADTDERTGAGGSDYSEDLDQYCFMKALRSFANQRSVCFVWKLGFVL